MPTPQDATPQQPLTDDDASARRSPLNQPRGPDERPLEDGIGLSLSGGGYRAMLFHLGTLWRLYEAGLLKSLARISSVSGGSITSAMLGLRWKELSFEPAKLQADFVPQVVTPLRALAGSTLDRNAVLGGVFLPGTVGEHVAQAYDKALFKGATLQDLPPEPRFVINATNVQSGALWRFSRPYMGDYRVGRVANPGLKLALAVAASSAFPPVLSPLTIDLNPFKVEPDSGSDLNAAPYTSHVVLSDGGVYDNLGIETVWKRFKTVLVSDAGQQIVPEPEPHDDWARHSYRVFGLVDNQVRALRKRQVIASFEDGSRKGAYWGIGGVASAPGTPLSCPLERTHELARIPTRLARLEQEVQEQLINWGFAAADFGLRTHYKADLPPPAGFPYPDSAV